MSSNFFDASREKTNSLLLMQDDTNATADMRVPLRERWMQDIEMFSKYLDIKSCNVTEHTDYLAVHPEIKQLIADYVLTLLIVKPVDVLDFTIQHFKAFAKEPTVWDVDLVARQFVIDIHPHQHSKVQSNIVCDVHGVCVKCTFASQSDKSIFGQHEINF